MVVSGYCPVQEKDVDIDIEYISWSTTTDSGKSKGVKRCEYAKHYGACTINCPLYDSAPKNL